MLPVSSYNFKGEVRDLVLSYELFARLKETPTRMIG